MAKDIQNFLAFAKGLCDVHGVRLHLLPIKSFGTVTGWFSGDTLKVATLNNQWVMVLAHELGHLIQDKVEGRWKRMGAWTVWENWLEGKNYPPQELLRAVRTVQRCELDAERKSIRLMNSYDLWEGVEEKRDYIRRCNIYVWAHEVSRRERKWYKTKPGVVPSSPTRLISERMLGKPPGAVVDTVIKAFMGVEEK